MEKELKQLKMAQLRAELSEKKAAIAEARWRAEASYTARITEANEPKARGIAIAEHERELARCESHEQAAVAEFHKAVAILMAEAAKGDEPQPETAKDDRESATAISFDGTQTGAMLAAIAILKDAPHIPEGCSFEVSVMAHLTDEYSVHALAYNRNNETGNKCLSLSLLDIYNKEEQIEKYTEWRAALDNHFAQGKEADNE